jgi:hypothetical protein
MPKRTREEILAGLTVVKGHVLEACPNCGGTGNYPSSMLPAGKCRLYCWQDRPAGMYGKVATPVDTYVRREQARDRRADKAAAEWAARQGERDARAAAQASRIANPDARVADALAAFGLTLGEPEPNVLPTATGAQIVADVAWRWAQRGELSEAQWALIAKLAREQRERDALRASAPAWEAGRFVVEGKVLSTKTVDSDYGTTRKMLVQEDSGRKLWCSVPSAIYGVGRGDRVRMTISVEPSADDPTFAVGSRPAKATATPAGEVAA